MSRKAVLIKWSDDGKRCIAIDKINASLLLNFINQDNRYRKKFDYICTLILGNHLNRELYDKEEPDAKSVGVRAMKLFKGQENARIYCKETNLGDGTLVVVVVEVLKRKKQTKLSYKELNIIHRVAQNDYEEFE